MVNNDLYTVIDYCYLCAFYLQKKKNKDIKKKDNCLTIIFIKITFNNIY